jgi:two-component sensor histidine kinase
VKVFAELYRKTRQLEDLNQDLEMRVSERTAALEASAARLRESEQGRSLALAAGNMGSWEYSLADQSWQVDEGQFRIFGLEPTPMPPPPGAVQALFHPEDWNKLHEALNSATEDERSFQTELRIVRPTGEVRWCLVAAAVAFGTEGRPQRVSGVTIDITDRKEAERKQTLLAREVDHRARNALAIVQAIVRLGRASSIDDYVIGVEGRVRALALSHELLSQSRWQGADIARLVSEEFAPYQSGHEPRVKTEGTAIILPADKAQTVGLIIHELATNAAKYGALSVPTGRVQLSWDVHEGQLSLNWRETGGPGVAAPKTKGFGTRIIESSLNRRKGDHAQFEWLPDGLHCRIELSVVPRQEEAMPQPPARPVQAVSPDRPQQVLVVEDEALVGMLTSELVGQMGYSVVGPCVDLKEAIRVSRHSHIDGAILDVNLGGELVFPLARLLADRSVPLVFLTGYEKSIIERGFEMFPVLQKPVPADELQKVLNGMLGPTPGGKAAKAEVV